MKNKKLLLIILSVLSSAVILSGCLNNPGGSPESETPTPEPTTTVTDLPSPTLTASPTEEAVSVTPPTTEATATFSPEPTATAAPTATPAPTVPAISDLPHEDLGAANYLEAYEQIEYISSNLGSDLPYVKEYCAYIKGSSMAMDGQTDIIFDYVEWLSDPEATAAYLEDHPGAAPEDYEFIQYIGYIRNIDPDTVTLHTSTESRYFLNRPLYTSQIGEVDYDEFRDWLFTLTDDAFVIVCEVDDIIARVEWIYMP